MSYNADVFIRQMPVIRDFLFHYVSYRELHPISKSSNKHKTFIDYTINAHYLQAINCWCMVFGSDRTNPTHWKHIVTNEKDRNEIISRAQFDANSWNGYWTELTNFRNNFSAHRDLYFLERVPFLDKALEISLVYDEWIREYIKPDVLEDPLLRDLINEYQQELKELAESLNNIV